MKINEFIKRNGITAEVSIGNQTKKYGDWRDETDTKRWRVILKCEATGRRMMVPFFGGAATEKPTAADVLGCLASDASAIDSATDFDEWADELGFEMGSAEDRRQARKIYDQAVKLRDKLAELIEDEEYDLLLWGCERE